MVKDAHLILRRWMSRPFGVAATIVSLALAMGVVAAAWTLVDTLLLRPFPYADATRLAYVWGSNDAGIRRGLTTEAIDTLASSQAFDGVSLFLPAVRVVVGLDPRNTALAIPTDGTFLRVLGVKPLLGRGLREEIPPLDEQEVLVSYSAWRSLFGARSDIVGAEVIIDGAKRTVVGVMPRGFFFPDPTAQLWVPHRRDQRAGTPGQMMFLALVRVDPERTLESAKAEIATLLSLPAERPQRAPAVGIFPLTDVAVRDYHRAVWSLTAAAVSLLLLIVANVTTIQMTRLHGRRSELAIRSALGATPARLLRELLIEQFMVTAAAGILGLPIAQVCMALAKHVQLLDGSRVQDAEIGLLTGGVLVVLALVTAPIATVAGGRSVRWAPASGFLTGDTHGGGHKPSVGLRSVVLFELSVAPPLLLAGSMFFSSFAQAVTTEWGFRPSNAAMFAVRFPPSMARRVQRQVELTEDAMRSIARLPQVAAVGMAYRAPVRQGDFQRGVVVRVHGKIVGSDVGIEEQRVSHGYFSALGADILQGREFEEADGFGREPVAIINRTLAGLLFPNENPVGRVIHLVREPMDLSDVPGPLALELKDSTVGEIPRRIVGVVDDVRMSGLQKRFWPVVYTEYRQQDKGLWYGCLEPRFIIRSRPAGAVPVEQVVGVLRAQVTGGEVGTSCRHAHSDGKLDWGARRPRPPLFVRGSFHGHCRPASGHRGVRPFSDVLNRKETDWGVRIALGAGPWAIVGELAREVLPVLGTGLALGVAASVASSFVIGASVVSGGVMGATWLLAGLVLGGTVGGAAAGPLWRALRLDPVRLLRSN